MPHFVSRMEVAPQWLQQIREALRAVQNRQVEDNNCFEVISLEDVPENYAEFLSKDEEEELFESAEYICAQSSETKVHFLAKTGIGRAVLVVSNDGRGQPMASTGKMPVLKLFSCGDVREKFPDISVSLPDEEFEPEIVGEVEYAHLDLADLLEESIFLLTEYTTPRYCVAVKIFPNQADFRCIIFVLERLETNVFDPQKRASIEKTLESNKPKKENCIRKVDFSQIDIFDPNVNRELEEFGVRMVFLQEILEADIGQDVIISLQGYRDPIVLRSQMFVDLRNLHHERWNRLHAQQEDY